MNITRKTIERGNTKVFPLSGGNSVRLRMMSGAARDRWINIDSSDSEPTRSLYCELLVRTLAEDGGELSYAENEAYLLARVMPWALIQEIFPIAMEYNGMGKAASESAKKNSTGPSEGSGSDSPGILACLWRKLRKK